MSTTKTKPARTARSPQARAKIGKSKSTSAPSQAQAAAKAKQAKAKANAAARAASRATLQRAGRIDEQFRDEAAACAKVAALPLQHAHAAGIDVGDATHWVCASGVYGHVLFLTLLEEGFTTLMTSPSFTRQIKGRPKTDKRDCPWIQRLHAHGLLPSVFQPDEATQTLRDLVRQRANHVRLIGQHIQRMQKALKLMNLKLTKVLGDVTGVTGLKIIRALVKGVRDPLKLAKLRDRRCKHTEAEIATALDGRYRPEHVLELKLCLTMWEHYQAVIVQLDEAIDQQLQKMRTPRELPPLPRKPRVRGKMPHDPGFDVRTALYYLTGVDLTALEGIDEMHALTLMSELGTDFSKWPTVKHFTSWLGLCPNWKKTGGKVKSSKTRKGKNRAATALRLAAWSLVRSHSYLGAYLRRQRARLGMPKA